MKAKETGMLKFMTMIEYEICKLECEQDSCRFTAMQERFNYLRELRANTNSNYWILITIRPKDETLVRLQEVTNRIVSKKWLKDKCLYVYEQKGETIEELGQGMHVHILAKLIGMKHGNKQKSKKQCLDEIISTCRTFKLNIEDNCIDAKVGPKRDVQQVIGYLTGVKASEEKHKAQKMDILWREKNGIISLYGTQDSM